MSERSRDRPDRSLIFVLRSFFFPEHFMQSPILPPATIGVFGSGQLGRMLALAARPLGYRIHTFSPDADSPTGMMADREVSAAYDDLAAVRDFVQRRRCGDLRVRERARRWWPRSPRRKACPCGPAATCCIRPNIVCARRHFWPMPALPVAPFVPVRSLDDLQTGHRRDRTACRAQDRLLRL